MHTWLTLSQFYCTENEPKSKHTEDIGDVTDLIGEDKGEANIPFGNVRTLPAFGLVNLLSNSGSILISEAV